MPVFKMSQVLAKNKFLYFWLPVVLYAGIIFYLSSLTLAPGPEIPFLDKFLHLLEYSVLGFLLSRAIKISFEIRDSGNLYLLVMAIAFIYGVSDEFHQAFVPGRTVSLWDMVTDGVGGLLGAFIFRWRK